nr:hypothetical protein BaRGS_034084 [Batillaria attramentaria]
MDANIRELQNGDRALAVDASDWLTDEIGRRPLAKQVFFSSRKMPIKEFYLDRVLSEMNFTMDEFIDLCILLGCDYCESIKGIGPKRAVELIRQYKNIETILKHLDTKKYPVPEDWMYQEARRLFQEPEVTDPEELELKWSDPDEEGLVEFMVTQKSFK